MSGWCWCWNWKIQPFCCLKKRGKKRRWDLWINLEMYDCVCQIRWEWLQPFFERRKEERKFSMITALVFLNLMRHCENLFVSRLEASCLLNVENWALSIERWGWIWYQLLKRCRGGDNHSANKLMRNCETVRAALLAIWYQLLSHQK